MERIYLGGLGNPPLYLGDDLHLYTPEPDVYHEADAEDEDWDERDEEDECTHGNSKDECEEICKCGHQCSQHDLLDGWCHEKGCQCQSWEER